MATVHSTGNFAEILWPGIRSIYGTTYKHHPSLYPEFMETLTSDKAFEKDQQITGFPTAGVKDQGDEANFSQMFQGYQQEYQHITYSIGAVVTREMYEDDQYNTIMQIPRLLAQSMRHTEEIVATNVLNNGFSTTDGPDGEALFSTSHPLVGGGTGSNQPATASDLTQTSLEQAIIDIADYRDEQGLRLNAYPEKLIVPRSLLFTARKILETQYETGTGNNTINIVSNMNIKPVVTNFLTDQDAWFIKTDVTGGLKFFTRREAELDRDNDFETENLKLKTTKRFAVGHSDWRATYGSPGAG